MAYSKKECCKNTRRMLQFALEIYANTNFTPTHYNLGNKILEKLYGKSKYPCEICGSKDPAYMDHAAIWEDNEGNNHIVCELCHLELKKEYFIATLPSKKIFQHGL